MFWGELAEVLDGVVPVIEAADQTLLDTARKIETARRRLDAAQALVVGELDVRGTTDIADGLATGRWLSQEAGISDHAAGGLVRVARALRVELPATAEALSAGVIGFEHAKVMTDAINPRIASAFREIETELIDQAGGMAFRAWRDHVKTVAASLDQDGGYDPDDDVYSNRLSVRGSSEGTDVSGRLVGPAAVTVR
ncbi:MAG: 13E12 repeat family protein, partial [Microthrixaceae bacterium]|nr:13E12 repeat family protein [Microthrixaceae bacterium]